MTQVPAFKATYGFKRDEVSLGNWRDAPWNVWAFRNVSEFIPTARIAATPGLAEDPVVSAEGLLREQFTFGGERSRWPMRCGGHRRTPWWS